MSDAAAHPGSSTSAAQVDKAAQRLLLIFLVPLIVIGGLATYTVYLSFRLAQVEHITQKLELLIDQTLIERRFLRGLNYEWSIRQYEQLAKKPNLDPNILIRLAGLYISRGGETEKQKGVRVLKQAEALYPKHWEIYSLLTYVYLLAPETEREALRVAGKGLELNPFDAETHNNIAWLYATTEDKALRNLEKAEHHALEAVQYTLGRKAEYLDTLAEIYFRQAETRRDGALARRAVETITKAIGRERGQLGYLEQQKERFRRGAKGL